MFGRSLVLSLEHVLREFSLVAENKAERWRPARSFWICVRRTLQGKVNRKLILLWSVRAKVGAVLERTLLARLCCHLAFDIERHTERLKDGRTHEEFFFCPSTFLLSPQRYSRCAQTSAYF